MPRKRVSTQIIGHSLSSRSRHKYHEMVAQIPLQMGGGGGGQKFLKLMFVKHSNETEQLIKHELRFHTLQLCH